MAMQVRPKVVAFVGAVAVSGGSLLYSAVTNSGNSNSGHDYGAKLSENDKRDVIEYLKAL